jgi:hypothetical protein
VQIKTGNAIAGVHAEIYYRKVGNEVPRLALRWDEKAFGLTKEQCIEALRNSEPHIEVHNGMGRELVKRTDPQPKHERQPGNANCVISSHQIPSGRETKGSWVVGSTKFSTRVRGYTRCVIEGRTASLYKSECVPNSLRGWRCSRRPPSQDSSH